MNNPIYLFYLNVTGNDPHQVYPVYKSDLALDYELESSQLFHRAKLSGKIDFIGDDYDWIMSQPVSTEFGFVIRMSLNGGSSFSTYWQGSFVMTDCEVNEDDRKIVVQPKVADRYAKLLDNWETEYDLIKDLSPKVTAISSIKQGIIQYYVEGNSVIDCIQGSRHWTEDVDNDVYPYSTLLSNYHFGIANRLLSVRVTPMADSNGDMPEITLDDLYTGTSGSGSGGYPNYSCTGTTYDVVLFCDSTTAPSVDYYIKDHNNNPLYFDVQHYGVDMKVTGQYTLTPYQGSGMKGNFLLDVREVIVCARWLTSTSNDWVVFNGNTVDVYDRPSDDISATNWNYMRCIPMYYAYSTYTFVQISKLTSEDKTEWGQSGDDRYYLPPVSGEPWMPINRENWPIGVSYWALPLDSETFINADDTYKIKDTFAVSDVISALLQEITGGEITHQATTDYSQFLYAPVNPIDGKDRRLFIAPKTNITAGEYSEAAKKGVITLKMVLDMLAKSMKAYWFIDTDNRLRIEHLSWFMKGKSYTTDANTISVDLTKQLEWRNKKPWDFGKNNYTFDKADMPSRYTYKWMDDVTDMFTGQPIVIENSLVEEAKKEEVSVSNFTSDIAFMLASPNAIGKDGFGLVSAFEINSYINGSSDTLTGSNFHDYGITAIEGGEVITISITATNTSGQPQTIEYGWAYGTSFNKRGEIPTTGSDPFTTIVQFVAPMDLFSFYLRSSSQSTAFSMSYTINYVRGGEFQLNTGEKTYTTTQATIKEEIPNYELSFEYLLPTFCNVGLPASPASFNGQTAVAVPLPARNKKQSVKIPIGDNADPDVEKLVKTSIGSGSVEKMSVSLSSRVATTSLKHETYDTPPVIVVPSPSVTPASGEITLSQTITIAITGIATGAEYSTDNETWTTYTSPFTLASDAVVYARATDGNGHYSSVVSVAYVVLPYNSKVEYLQSSGTQYIDTGILPDVDTNFVVDLQMIETPSSDNYILGKYGSSQEFYLYASSGKYRYAWSSSNRTTTLSIDTNRHTISMYSDGTNSYLYVDGNKIYERVTLSHTATRTTTIFRGGTTGVATGFPQKIYSCTMSKNGSPIIDLIPVRVGTTGYMYDKVSGQLFGNAGSGSFTYGNDI